jgi:N-carbamoyl-L-amino-acid hydrolase
MDQRRDALLAAAKFIEAVNQVVTSVPGRQVGTVGRIQVSPGATNVIPGKAVLSLELRDLDTSKIATLYAKIRGEADEIAKATGTSFDFKEMQSTLPALANEEIRHVITETANELGLTTNSMPSGAGHDAQDMARLAPMGMIFIPSVDGVSHAPKEFTRPEDIANGASHATQIGSGAVVQVRRHLR